MFIFIRLYLVGSNLRWYRTTKLVLVTHRLTSNFSIKILENSESDRQIDHLLIICRIILLFIKTNNL